MSWMMGTRQKVSRSLFVGQAILKMLVSRHYVRNRCEYVRSHSRSRMSTLLSRSRTALFNVISPSILAPSVLPHDVAENMTDGTTAEMQLSQIQSNITNQGENAASNTMNSEYAGYAERLVVDGLPRNNGQNGDVLSDLHTFSTSPPEDLGSLSPSNPVDSPLSVEMSVSTLPTVAHRRFRRNTGLILCSGDLKVFDD